MKRHPVYGDFNFPIEHEVADLPALSPPLPYWQQSGAVSEMAPPFRVSMEPLEHILGNHDITTRVCGRPELVQLIRENLLGGKGKDRPRHFIPFLTGSIGRSHTRIDTQQAKEGGENNGNNQSD